MAYFKHHQDQVELKTYKLTQRVDGLITMFNEVI